MRFHIEMRGGLRARRLDADQARRQTEARLGPLLQTREQGYD
jgi:hypothetical protein